MTNAIVTKMQQDLLEARKSRDQLTTELLQSTLSRITNAEAVPQVSITSTVGVGATEVARRELTDADIQAIIHEELAELAEAHASMADHPDHPYTVDLAKKIALLKTYI